MFKAVYNRVNAANAELQNYISSSYPVLWRLRVDLIAFYLALGLAMAFACQIIGSAANNDLKIGITAAVGITGTVYWLYIVNRGLPVNILLYHKLPRASHMWLGIIVLMLPGILMYFKYYSTSDLIPLHTKAYVVVLNSIVAIFYLIISLLIRLYGVKAIIVGFLSINFIGVMFAIALLGAIEYIKLTLLVHFEIPAHAADFTLYLLGLFAGPIVVVFIYFLKLHQKQNHQYRKYINSVLIILLFLLVGGYLSVFINAIIGEKYLEDLVLGDWLFIVNCFIALMIICEALVAFVIATDCYPER